MVEEKAVDKGQKEYPRVRPVADILQKDESYYIIIDMPGVNKEDLNIAINEKVLTVEADTTYPHSEKERLLESEFGNVHYIRKFTLSDTVDQENIKANLDNGVVKLHLPKVKEMQPKKIEVEEG